MMLTEIKKSRPLIITNKVLSTLKQLSKITEHLYLCSDTIIAKVINNTIFAETTFEISLDDELGIDDLTAFIKLCHNGSEVFRDGEDIIIINGTSEVRLPHTPKESLHAPKSKIAIPKDCKPLLLFFINKATITAIKKLNGKKYPSIHFISDGKSIAIKASSYNHYNSKGENAEATHSIMIAKAELPTPTDIHYEIIVSIKNLSFLDAREQEIGFYTKANELVAAMTVKNPDIEFIVATESSSTLIDKATT
ncbi:hypothetical protein AB4526_16910 [Vibrio cyclitrophicus]